MDDSQIPDEFYRDLERVRTVDERLYNEIFTTLSASDPDPKRVDCLLTEMNATLKRLGARNSKKATPTSDPTSNHLSVLDSYERYEVSRTSSFIDQLTILDQKPPQNQTTHILLRKVPSKVTLYGLAKNFSQTAMKSQSLKIFSAFCLIFSLIGMIFSNYMSSSKLNTEASNISTETFSIIKDMSNPIYLSLLSFGASLQEYWPFTRSSRVQADNFVTLHQIKFEKGSIVSMDEPNTNPWLDFQPYPIPRTALGLGKLLIAHQKMNTPSLAMILLEITPSKPSPDSTEKLAKKKGSVERKQTTESIQVSIQKIEELEEILSERVSVTGDLRKDLLSKVNGILQNDLKLPLQISAETSDDSQFSDTESLTFKITTLTNSKPLAYSAVNQPTRIEEKLCQIIWKLGTANI